MARKEHEMIFQLQAQLGNSFNSTFKSAQGQITAMQSEIVALHSAQSDISAYQKQQAAVEATQKKMEVLQQQYDNIQREIQETEGFSSSLENKLLSKQQQIDKTAASLEKETGKLDQMGAELQEAGIDTDHLAEESQRLGNEIEALKKQEEQAAQQSKSFGEQTVNAFDAISAAIVAAGVANALNEIYDAYMQCVNVASSFEATMSTVEALSGASAQEMQALSDEAKALGAATKFSAVESAEAMTYMGMAGWNASQMLAGMDGVLQLAAASGEDLALTSDIVTDALTAFGLTAADTAHFADVLAATATNSNTSVAIMGDTFKNVASIAGALHYSVEDVSVAIGLMANSGIKGGEAGTALKNTLNGLLEGVLLTSDAFGEYEVSAVNADGTMKSFGETVDELRYYFNQMTDAERVANAQAIAGNRTYNGLLSIINAADSDYASLTESINNCTGAAAKMAAIKLDNAQGELTLMQSAWEGLTISVGEKFTPAMREVYAVGAQAFSGLSQFVDANPAAVKAVAAFVAVVGTATAGLTAYAAISKVIKALDMATLFTGPAGAIMLAVGAVAALSAGVVGLVDAMNEADSETYEMTAATKAQYDEIQNLQNAYDKAVSSYGATSEEALRLKYQIDDLNAAYENSYQTIEQFSAECDVVISAHSEMVSAYQESNAAQEQSSIETLALIQKLSDLAGQTDQTAETQEAMNAIISELNSTYSDLNLTYEDVIANSADVVQSLKDMAQAQAEQEAQQEAYENYVAALRDEASIEDQLTKAKQEQIAAQERVNEAQKAYSALIDEAAYDPSGSAAMMAAWSAEAKELDAAQNALRAANDAVDELTVAQEENVCVQNEIEQQWMATAEAAQAAADSTASAMATTEEAVSTAWSAVETDLLALCDAYNKAYASAYESISGQYSLWDEVGKISKTSMDDLNKALDSQISYWESYSDNLANLHSRNIEGLDALVASMDDGSEESSAALAAMASASDSELSAMVSKYGDLQNAQGETANAVAELETDFSARMAEIESTMTSTVDKMNMSDDAAAAAKSTMSGYIQSLIAKGNEAVSEAQSIARRISQALSSAKASAPKAGVSHYATGTISAEPGLAMVGEEGPELIYFNGGEQVINATETAAMMQRLTPGDVQAISFAPQLMTALAAQSVNAVEAMPVNGAPSVTVQMNFSPSYNLSGASSSLDVQAILQEHSADLREFIQQVIADATHDAIRSAFK